MAKTQEEEATKRVKIQEEEEEEEEEEATKRMNFLPFQGSHQVDAIQG